MCRSTKLRSSNNGWFDDQWMKQSGPALVACPRCGVEVTVTECQCEPPLGFGTLSFSFWNWPPLDSPSWKINILSVVREITGHALVCTWGRI